MKASKYLQRKYWHGGELWPLGRIIRHVNSLPGPQRAKDLYLFTLTNRQDKEARR